MASGGKRKGAGRKPSPDKKIKVDLYIKTSIINQLGGIEKAKQILNNFAEIEAGGEIIKTENNAETSINSSDKCNMHFVSGLLCCPFCGNTEPTVKKVNEGVSYVECFKDECNAQPYCEGDNIEDAKRKWNLRANNCR